MSKKSKCDELYANLIQKNIFNQLTIRKYTKYMQANYSKFQRANITTDKILPLLKNVSSSNQIKPISTTIDRMSMKTQKNHKYSSCSIEKEVSIITAESLENQKTRIPMSLTGQEELLKRKLGILQSRILRRKIAENMAENNKQHVKSVNNLSCKTPLNLKNIIFQSQQTDSNLLHIEAKLRVAPSPIKMKKNIPKHFILGPTTQTIESPQQPINIFQKQQNLLKFINLSMKNLLEINQNKPILQTHEETFKIQSISLHKQSLRS